MAGVLRLAAQAFFSTKHIKRIGYLTAEIPDRKYWIALGYEYPKSLSP